MVVLSAAIVSSGKTLMARQFVEMTRLRVEGLISAFQKLVDSGKDHTFIETETVRYVYQPMESLHLVLVTNKSSNILEDLETLRLLAKVVQDCCQLPVNEELCVKNALDIVFAFDEVISFGHRESVTLSQIKSYTEMDSHEEKLSQMIQQSKENEAREASKKKEKEMSAKRREMEKNAKAGGGGGSMPGFGSGSMGNDTSDPAPSIRQDNMSSGGFGGGGSGIMPESSPPFSSSMSMSMGANDDAPVLKPKAPGKSMVLGKKKIGDTMGDMMGLEKIEQPGEAAKAEAPAERAAPVVNPLLEPVKVDIEEKIEAKCEIEGGLDGEASCTGQFQVTVLDAAKADLVCFKLAPQDNSFKYKVHPNLNKASQAANVLEVRDASKAFRANMPAPLLKWQMKSNDDAFLPVTLSCWPTSTADGTQMVLEFELTDESITLENVFIRFPASNSSRPAIASASPGDCVYDAGSSEVVWHIPVIDKSENSGTLEFSATADQASLLPATFTATRRGQTRCPMEILECYHQERKDAIDFACEKNCTYILTIG